MSSQVLRDAPPAAPATALDVWPGTPYPLGATYDGMGVNFSIFSEIAQRVELCLFDEEGNETRADLPEVIRLAATGAVDLKRAVSRRFTIEQAAEAYDALNRGEIVGRAIKHLGVAVPQVRHRELMSRHSSACVACELVRP